MIKIIESPREGMQGFSRVIPTKEKVEYINRLLRVGFDTVETGSTASPKLIPQLADSMEVLGELDIAGTRSNRMLLAPGLRGAALGATHERVTHIAYPYSFSAEFLRLNVNSTLEQSLDTAKTVVKICGNNGKTAVIYISMAFGNPYGDPWSLEMLTDHVGLLFRAGARIIPLSNVSAEISAELIGKVFSALVPAFPEVEFGLHLHTTGEGWLEKTEAAWEAGVRRFDSVINGLGGCPMAGKEMLGNLKTENLMEFADRKGIPVNIDREAFAEAVNMAGNIF